MEQVSNRIIYQYDALLAFSADLAESNDNNAKEVLAMLEKFDTKCYLLLFQRVLGELNALNRLLQKRGAIIHVLKSIIEMRYKNIVSIIMKRYTYVLETLASEINLLDSSNYLPFQDFELRQEMREYFHNHNNEMESFCKNAFNFIFCVALQIKERFYNFYIPMHEITQ